MKKLTAIALSALFLTAALATTGCDQKPADKPAAAEADKPTDTAKTDAEKAAKTGDKAEAKEGDTEKAEAADGDAKKLADKSGAEEKKDKEPATK